MYVKALVDLRLQWIPETATILSDTVTGDDGCVVVFTYEGNLNVLRFVKIAGAFHASKDYEGKLANLI